MAGVSARALAFGGLIGLIDALWGLAALGLNGRHLAALLVVIALHQALALGLALSTQLLMPDVGEALRMRWADWSAARRGATGELGAALSWMVNGLAVLIAWAAGAWAVHALQDVFATKLYEHLLQVLACATVFAIVAWAAWRVGYALRRLEASGPLTRMRLLSAAVGLGTTAYLGLWFERDLFFKEVPPLLALLFGGHLLACLLCQLPGRAVARPALIASLLLMLLSLVGLGAWSGVAPMMRRGAPAAQLMVAVVDQALDWDGDGIASHFGANDCAPFDARVFPGAVDLPDDGIDQDCYRGDLSSAGTAVADESELPKVGNLRRPHTVVLVSVDALRPDRLGLYGYTDHPTSPGIDAWAKEAVVFDNAYTSGPYTIAAIPGLLSARGISQIPNYIAEKGSYKLAEELKTLPEIMRKLGYHTTAITSGLDPKKNGFAQGLDRLFVVTKSKHDTADSVVSYAKQWLQKRGGRRGFLWMHLFDPHDPYQRIKGIDFGARPSDRYDASIAFMDKHLAPFLKDLAKDPDVAVVLVSDHGEAFGEHGATNHGHNVYRENAHIPLIVRWGGAKAGRHQGAVSILDVLPTLVQLGGGSRAPGFGRSLVPQLLGESSDLQRGVLTESYRKGQLYALSTGTDRLIYVQDEGRYERYDMVADPKELNDLHGQDPGKDRQLEDQLYEHLAQGVLLRRGLTVARMLPQVLPPGAVLVEPQRFGDDLELVGVRWFVGGKTKEKPEYVLSLYWRAKRVIKRSWRIALGIKTGRRSINRDHTPGFGYVPGRGTFPTHQWPVGVVVEDRVVVGRLDKYGIRDYQISLGVYEGKEKLMPEPGPFEQNAKGTRVMLKSLKRVKPLIWGRFGKAKGSKP